MEKWKDCISVLTFGKKIKENIALFENKNFGRGCFKPSEHSLYSTFFPLSNNRGWHY